MNRIAVIPLAVFLLITGLCVPVLAQDPPDLERPLMVRGERDLVPLAEGLRWWMPEELRQGLVPRVSTVPVPEIEFEGLTTLGLAYRIEWDGGPLRVPVELEFTLPESAFREGMRIVFIRQDDEGIAFIPARTDPEARTATVYTTGFSTWIPAEMADAVGYVHAYVHGNINQVLECEQDPKIIWFDVTGSALVDGEAANFPVPANGPGPYVVSPPIPEWLFGTYTFHSLIGCSDDYLFGNPGENPTRVIDEPITYMQDMEVVPTTFNLEGTVKDKEGNPVEGIRLEIHSDDVVYGTSTKDGGAYKVWMVGAGGPQYNPQRTVRYLLKDDEHDCPESGGTIDVIIGQTNEEDLVYEAKGDVRGFVYDDEEPCDLCEVELKDVNGDTYNETSHIDGSFEFRDIPVGQATLTTNCPPEWGDDSDTQSVEVSCDEGEGGNLYITLDCSEPGQYRASILIEKGTPATVHAVLDGMYEFDVDQDGNISGSGDGTFSITAGGGACSGSVGATISGGGEMKSDRILFDLTFEDEGVMSFVCNGTPTPVPDSIDAFEDEGKLEVPIQSQDPFQATLEKTTPGPAPAQWHYTIDVVKTSE